MSTEPLNISMDSELYARVMRAAELEGRSITDFVALAVQEAAMRVLQQSDIVKLTLAGQEQVAQSLLQPPQPTSAMKRAFARHDQLLREK